MERQIINVRRVLHRVLILMLTPRRTRHRRLVLTLGAEAA